MKVEGRVAVVTGASSGIGRETALALAGAGAKLVIAARRLDLLEELATECRSLGAPAVLPVATDVTERRACEQLIERASELGELDILVNNAGYAIFDDVTEASPEDLRGMMDTNFFGAVWCTRAALPGMLGRGRGSIVTVASIAGIMGFAGMTGYCASKFALIGFMEGLRDEVVDRGIEVSVICPGTTRTDFFTIAQKGKMPAASRLVMAVPPRRIARAVVGVVQSPRPRMVVPASASLFMRFKELAPRTAHLMMRRTSALLERRKSAT